MFPSFRKRRNSDPRAGDIETVNNGMENSPSIALSCSIGAAIYPKHGKSFKELYRHADLALYQSKKNGKNQYNVYDGSYQQERILRPYTQPASIPEEKVDADGTGNLLDHLSDALLPHPVPLPRRRDSGPIHLGDGGEEDQRQPVVYL